MREESPDLESMDNRIALTRRRLENLETGRVEHWHVRASTLRAGK